MDRHHNHIHALIGKIQELQDQLEVELAVRRAELKYRIDHERIVFEEDMARRHAAIRKKLLAYIVGARPLMIVTAPFIYAVIIPFVLLDVLVTLYQSVCFPVYGIPRVRRADYLVFDRSNLQYLNAIEKFNCAYCAYGNGIVAYVREVASRTEQYWCPIKHARRLAGAHARYASFVDFGDAEAYRDQLETLRAQLRQVDDKRQDTQGS